jgi:hypothetical protein
MEVYNGSTCDFNLSGVPSVRQREMRWQLVEAAAISLLNVATFVAQTLGLIELQREFMKLTADLVLLFINTVTYFLATRSGKA